MIRRSKVLDIPRILKAIRNLCYLPKYYVTDLPGLILGKHIYIAEDNGNLTGLLGFYIENKILTIDCVYALTGTAEEKQKIVKSLIDYALAECSNDITKWQIVFDAISNESPNLEVLENYNLQLTSCRVVSGTQHMDMPKNCSVAKWGDRLAISSLIKDMSKELDYSEEECDSLQLQCSETFKYTVVYTDSKNNVLGFATICDSNEGASSGIANILTVYVKPEMRNQHIGTSLITACIALAGKRRAHFIETTINREDAGYLDMFKTFDVAVFRGIANYPVSTVESSFTQIPSSVFG